MKLDYKKLGKIWGPRLSPILLMTDAQKKLVVDDILKTGGYAYDCMGERVVLTKDDLK